MVKRPPKPTLEHVWKEAVKPALDKLGVELSEKELAICNTFVRKLWDYKAKFDGKITPELVEITKKEIEEILNKHSDVAERLKPALLTIAKLFGIEIKLS